MMRRLVRVMVAVVLVGAGCVDARNPSPDPPPLILSIAPSASAVPIPAPSATASTTVVAPSVAPGGPPGSIPPAAAVHLLVERGATGGADYGFSSQPLAAGPSWLVAMGYESVDFATATHIGVSFPSENHFVAQDWWGGFDGEVNVIWASRIGRFVAVTLESDAARTCDGPLRFKIAVSRSNDPRGPWTFSEADAPPAGSGAIGSFDIAASDDKLVITTEDFCVDQSTGSRIRVMDLADLTDGGGVTVQDVTLAEPRTYRWISAQPVPAEGTTSVGATVHLFAAHEVGGAWTTVTSATLGGSARAGAAKLDVVDLSAAGIVAPSAEINGPTSAVTREGRMWAALNVPCGRNGAGEDLGCSRFVVLDVGAGSPTLVEDATIPGNAPSVMDPRVGVARDGTVYLVERQWTTPHREPDVLIGTWRHLTESIRGGRPNVVILARQGWNERTQGTIVPDITTPGVVRIVVGTDTGQGLPDDVEGADALTFLRLSVLPD
jgi:hypothetical protein